MTKILLVEDDKSLREIYGVRLLAEGYDIVSAGDGEEALAMAIKDRPDLILSDVMMPKISGFDMLDILRSTTETKNIKVIMMTALSSEDQRTRGEQLGADRYLVKSQVGIEDVVQTVHEVLGDTPQAAAQAQVAHAPVQQPQPQQPSQPATPPMQPQAPTASAPQASLLAPSPLQPQQPQAAPTPAPAPAQPQTPTTPQPAASSPLPQPTAPFSTPRPAGFGIGDRVIQPIAQEEKTGPDINTLLEKELDDTSPSNVFSTPKQPQSEAQQPTPAEPQAPAPAPQSSLTSPSVTPPIPPTIPSPLSQPAAATPGAPASPFELASAPQQSQTSSAPEFDFEETPRESVAPAPTPPANTNHNPFVNPSQPPTAQ